MKRSLLSDYKITCGEISMTGLFMVTARLAAVYGIAIFGPRLSLQNKIKAMKAKMNELMLFCYLTTIR
jgi:hypothetical protein